MTTLREFATKQMDDFCREEGIDPTNDREDRIDRWVHDLVSISCCTVPDEILAAMPEISRHNRPQDSPQQHECGCVAITRITDRDYRYNEEPFEMRLAIPCDGTNCMRHMSLLDASVLEAQRDVELLDAKGDAP